LGERGRYFRGTSIVALYAILLAKISSLTPSLPFSPSSPQEYIARKLVQWGKVAEFKKDLADCRKKPNAYFGYAVSFNIPVSEDAIEQFVEDARISRVRFWKKGLGLGEWVCVCSLCVCVCCVDSSLTIKYQGFVVNVSLLLPFVRSSCHSLDSLPFLFPFTHLLTHRRRTSKKTEAEAKNKYTNKRLYSTCARLFGPFFHRVVVDRNVRLVDKKEERKHLLAAFSRGGEEREEGEGNRKEEGRRRGRKQR
jgi:hypothetical protein